MHQLVNIRQLRICFKEYCAPAVIPVEILSQLPLLVNPVSRYQNMFEGTPTEFFDTFADCARKTLNRLHDLLNGVDHHDDHRYRP